MAPKSSFARVVDAVEIAAVGAVAVFLVLLFANEPDGGSAPSAARTEDTSAEVPSGGDEAGGGPADGEQADGAAVYADHCAGCHGGEGEGGLGPRLADGRVTEAFPDPADQREFVKAGGGGMPAFGSSLSDAEIEAVVDYTREEL